MIGTAKNPNNKGFDLFITTAPIPDLNDKLVVFGRVIKGEEIVQVLSESLFLGTLFCNTCCNLQRVLLCLCVKWFLCLLYTTCILTDLPETIIVLLEK